MDVIDMLPEDTECIILSDRGSLDVKAYLGQELFDKMSDEDKNKYNQFIGFNDFRTIT